VTDRVIAGHPSDREIVGRISSVPLRGRIPRYFWWVFLLFFVIALLFLFSIGWLLIEGIGTIGLEIPAAWGFMIVNTVWWIGIGHAGTLISAILVLLRQNWRNSINRFAEAMTLFAVGIAGLFPILHLGRPQ
jgi:molybdopterin-containing oxidoreductase family membrane subunit